MKFGICSSPDKKNYEKLVKAGAEFIEINGSALYSMSDADYEALKKRYEAGEINTYSCNGLCPGDLRLTGDVDFDKVKEYAEKTFGRLAGVGVKMLVFGSGKAKHVPDGFPMEKAWEQLFEVGKIFATEAKKNGQTIAIEGLRREEVNVVNTLDDINYYIENVGMDNFKMHADFYHMDQNGEPLTEINKYKDKLVHVHICGRNRGMPPKEDEEFIRDCISKLHEINYAGNVSFEGSLSSDMDEVKAMLDTFKSI